MTDTARDDRPELSRRSFLGGGIAVGAGITITGVLDCLSAPTPPWRHRGPEAANPAGAARLRAAHPRPRRAACRCRPASATRSWPRPA